MNDIHNRRGPWDAPLANFVNSKKIVIIIHDLEKNIVEQEIQIDYGNYDDRKFLGRLTYWSITNGRSVETIAYDDWEKGK